jgi:hypothetical protein
MTNSVQWLACFALGIVIEMLSQRHPHLVHPGNNTLH